MRKGKGNIIISIFLAMIFTLGLAPYAQADALGSDPTYGQEIRVLLEQTLIDTDNPKTSYSVTVGSGVYDIVEYDAPGNILATVTSGNITFSYDGSYGNYTYSYSGGGESGTVSRPLMAVPRTTDDNFIYDGTSYRGSFKVISGQWNFCIVNQIYVELYLYGVVGLELGYNVNMEATKAQAVAARSYARSRYSASNTYYDLTDDTYSQVYGGKSAETSKIREAVDNTRGWALKYNNQYAQTYYSSNMGGYSENIENVWSSAAVPIKGVPSPHDAMAGNYGSYGASTYSWVVEYSPEELVAKANAYNNTNIGEYRSISYSETTEIEDGNGNPITYTSVSGRALEVTITGSNGSVTVKKEGVRFMLDLKSSKITIEDETQSDTVAYIKGENTSAIEFDDLDDVHAIGDGGGTMIVNGSSDSIFVRGADHFVEIDKNNAAGDSIVITGYGYGHGVGLSQFGAIAMGDDDYTWDEIIELYFCTNTGIELVDSY